MSALHYSSRASVPSASRWTIKRARVSLAVRAQGTNKMPAAGSGQANEGTQLLKGLPSLLGTGTLSLKPGGGSGTQQVGSILQSLSGTFGRSVARTPGDAKTVFVAGSTGRTGARVVRELVKAGFKVRAGARNVEEAKRALEVATQYGLLTPQEAQAVQVVQVDLSKPENIKAAIGSARKVVCALGASESNLSFSEPKKVDGEFTINLINAAAAVNVQQFVLITSLGTGKIGFPASVLNLFGGILYWKREAEKALEGSGIPYTIVRPGGMERPTDSHKKTHNMVLTPRDSVFGGTVSRLQVAELVGSMLLNPELAENKVLEVTSETTAPKLTYQELLAGIRADVTREEQQAAKEAALAVQAQLQEAEVRANEARRALAAADARAKELADRLKVAKVEAAEVNAKVAPTLKEGAAAEKALQLAKAAADKAALQEAAAKAVLEAAKKAASQGQLLDKKQLKAVADEVLNPVPVAPKVAVPALAAAVAAPAAATTSTNSLFGFLGGAAPQAAPAAAPVAAAPAKAPAAPSKAPAPTAKPVAPAGGFSLGSLFGIPNVAPVQVEPGVKAPATKYSSTPAPAAAAAAAAPMAPEAAKPTAAAPPAKKKEPQSLFAGLFGKPISVEEAGGKVQVQPKEAPKPAAPTPSPTSTAPTPAPKPVAVAAVPPPPPPPPSPPPPPAKPAAPAKSAAPVEDPAEVERRTLAALAEERRQKALAGAKARLATEAAAVEATRAVALKAAQQKAPSPQPPAPAPVPAARAKPAVPNDAQIAEEKKKVQAWITAWQARQAADGNGTAPAGGNGVAVKAKQGGAYDEAVAAAAKADAQRWIAAWQAKQKASVKV